MTPRIAADPPNLTDAGTTTVAQSAAVSSQLNALLGTLSGCGGMCGDDPAGIVLAHAVDTTTRALVEALTGVANGTARIGDAIKASAANHDNADHGSNVDPAKGDPTPFPTETPHIDVRYPPSSEGSGGEFFLAKVVESIAGMAVPNGHQDKLRSAASAWRTMSGACHNAAGRMRGPAGVVDTQRIPEATQIDASIDAITKALNTSGETCTNLASSLGQYADHLDEVHQVLHDLLSKLGNPETLVVSGVLHLLTGAHTGLVKDIKTVLANALRETQGLGHIVAEYAEIAWQIAGVAARFAGIQLHNAAADIVNAAASFGNAIQHDPLHMGTDIATTAAGAALTVLGGGGEILGVGLDVTGIGAAAGIPVGVVSAGAITAGLGMACLGAADMTREAQTHMVCPMAKKPGGRGPGPAYVPSPKNLTAFPEATWAKGKTQVQGGGKLRPRWKDPKGNIYEWDYQHGTVEVYNKRGAHRGEFDPETGAQTKPADPTRKVEP